MLIRPIDAVDDQRFLWRIIDRIQRDALSRGVLRRGGQAVEGSWRSLEMVLAAAGDRRLYVAFGARGRIEGFMVLSTLLEPGFSGALEVVMFEAVCEPSAAYMVKWLKSEARREGFGAVGVAFLPGIDGFWRRMGFVRLSRFCAECRFNEM